MPATTKTGFIKAETLHALITGKTLLDEARQLISTGNQHACSAGLILLQDTLEIVFLALLKQVGADEQKNLETLSFDQLIGELNSLGIMVPKSGTLKALNKQRVVVKHYGQIADATSAQNYLNTATESINNIVTNVMGKGINDIYLADLLPDTSECKRHLQLAAELIEINKPLQALIEIRKAYFIEIEADYCIHKWAGTEDTSLANWFGLGLSGHKAPDHTKNKQWIATHVRQPLDYIQIDQDRLRLDAVEWGVNTSELRNIAQLTPQVMRMDKDLSAWHVKIDTGYEQNSATNANASYCLDKMISIAVKKHHHQSARRWIKNEKPAPPRPVYVGHSVFERADKNSKVVHVVQEGYTYAVNYTVTGFNPCENYVYIAVYPPNIPGVSLGEGPLPIHGYLESQNI